MRVYGSNRATGSAIVPRIRQCILSAARELSVAESVAMCRYARLPIASSTASRSFAPTFAARMTSSSLLPLKILRSSSTGCTNPREMSSILSFEFDPAAGRCQFLIANPFLLALMLLDRSAARIKGKPQPIEVASRRRSGVPARTMTCATPGDDSADLCYDVNCGAHGVSASLAAGGTLTRSPLNWRT